MRWRSRSWNSVCRRCTGCRLCTHKCQRPSEWLGRFQSWTWPDPCQYTIDEPETRAISCLIDAAKSWSFEVLLTCMYRCEKISAPSLYLVKRGKKSNESRLRKFYHKWFPPNWPELTTLCGAVDSRGQYTETQFYVPGRIQSQSAMPEWFWRPTN